MPVSALLGDLLLTDAPTDDPAFKLMTLDGWWSAPPVESAIDSIPLADGGYDAPTFRRPKKFSLNGVVTASSAGLARAVAWRRLSGLFPTGDALPLVVTDELGPLRMLVRPDSPVQVLPQPGGGSRSAFFSIPLVAPDPRKYGPVLYRYANTAVPNTDGLAFPLFDDGTLDFGTVVAPVVQTAVAVNTGTAPTWGVFAVDGPFDSNGFTVTGSDGSRITYRGEVPLGSRVLVSPYAGGRVTMSGADVTSLMTDSVWAPVRPGSSVIYSLTSLGAASTLQLLTVTYSEAWW